MLKTILLSIAATLATITALVGSLKALPTKDLPVEPAFGAVSAIPTSTTSPYYRYLNFEPSAKPLVSIWNVCNKIPDIQGGGFTYLTTYQGTPTWSKVSCE